MGLAPAHMALLRRAGAFVLIKAVVRDQCPNCRVPYNGLMGHAPERRGSGVTDEEVQRVLDSIDALGEGGNAEDRARRLTELLDKWPGTHARVREMRQQANAELYNDGNGLTYKEIGALLDISFGRVRQIIAGETVSAKRRKPEATAAEE